MIWFRSGSCLSKLERVKTNSIEVTKIINHYHIPTVQPKYIGPVRFYALLFASSCRPKRNCPAAETEHYFERCYNHMVFINIWVNSLVNLIERSGRYLFVESLHESCFFFKPCKLVAKGS